MTDPIPAARLAELRRMLADETWELPAKQDWAALIGEIEQLADFDALGQRGAALQAERDHAVRRWHDEHQRAERFSTDLAKALREAEDWRGVATERKADREQLVAAILRLKQQPGISRDAWFAYAAALEMARGTRIELRRRTPAERAAYLTGRRDDAIARGLPAELIDDMIADAEREAAPKDGRLYADGPPCRHAATWLVQDQRGWVCMVCGPAQAAESIPEDEGIASADAIAQVAADARAYCPDCALPETNCACG